MSKMRVILLAVLLVVIGIPDTVLAQSENSGSPTILRAVQDLQRAVDALAQQTNTGIPNQLTSITNQLTSLVNSVGAAHTPPTVLGTGFLLKPAGYSASCHATNVGVTPVTVQVELLRIDGRVWLGPFPETLAPANGNGFSLSVGTGPEIVCRFTMVDGSSSGIRASLDIIEDTTGFARATREAR
jgi:hypothetical protein